MTTPDCTNRTDMGIALSVQFLVYFGLTALLTPHVSSRWVSYTAAGVVSSFVGLAILTTLKVKRNGARPPLTH